MMTISPRSARIPGTKTGSIRILTALSGAVLAFSAPGPLGAQERGAGPARPPVAFDVGVRKSGPSTLTTGQTATFTLSPFNTGPSAVDNGSGVVVTDVLPATFAAPITANGASWTCTVAGLTITCSYGGPAVNGHQPLPVITITAMAQREGRFENCSEIALRPKDGGPRGDPIPMGGGVKDANPRDNRDCIRGEVTPDASKKDYDVSIRKRGPEGPLGVGQTATFTLSPHNNGPSSVDQSTGVQVTDQVPVNFGAPVTANGGPDWNCSVQGLAVTCLYTGLPAGVGPLPVITITAMAEREGRYENCAEIAFRGGDFPPRGGANASGGGVRDANPRDNRDCIRGEVTTDGGKKDYDVSIRKRGPEGPLTVGQTATFTLSPHNNGPSSVDPSTGVQVTDQVPANFGAPVTANGGADWNCTILGLAVTCVYTGGPAGVGPLPEITITAVAQNEGRYENCAEIAFRPRDGGPRTGAMPPGGGVRDANPRDNRDCIRGEVTPDVGKKDYDVGIRKRGPEGPLTVGQTATFTLSPHNNGPSSVDQSTGVQVTDALPANFGAPVTANGGADWTCSVQGLAVTCLYTGLPAGVGPLPEITITAVAQNEGRYENCAEIAFRPRDGGPRTGAMPPGGGVRDANPRDNRDCIRGEVTPETGGKGHDVSIRKLGGEAITIGGQVSFTLNPFNNGPDPVASITVTDVLPAGLIGPVTASGAGPGWTCTVVGQVVTCTYNGNGAPIGPSLPFPPITVQATGQTAGEFTNCATVAINGGADTNPQDNTDCRDYVVTGPQTGTITIVKDAQPEGPQWFAFTPSPSNIPGFKLDDDPNTTTFPDQNVMSGLQAGTYSFTEGATPGWTLTGVVCTSAPSPGRTAIFDRWGVQNVQTVTVELEPGDNVICTFTNVADPAPAAPDLAITKVGVVTETAAGHLITYTIVITNPGGTAPSGTIHLIDLLSGFPAGTIYNSASGVGPCSPPSPGTPWDCEVPASNLGVPITIEVVVPPGGASVTNCATVVLEGDPNVQNNEACATNTVTPPPTQTGTLTILKDVQPGDHAQDFTFTTVGAGLSNFSLDDDAGSSMPNSKTFTNLVAGPYKVTEDALSGWAVSGTGYQGSLNCGHVGPTASVFTPVGSSVTVDLVAGDHVTCTFINTQIPAPAAPDLAITKVGVVTETAAGHLITYTIVITNPGGTTPSGTIHLIDLLSGFPAGTIYNSASGVGPCSPPSPGTPWDCEVPASNLGVPITIEVVVPPGGASVTNCATVVLEGDPNVQNNEACVTNTIGPPVVTVCDDGNPNTTDVVENGVCQHLENSPTGSITIRKDAQPNDPQDFEFLFVNNTAYSYLDDDDDGLRQDNHVFSGLAGGATYTFTETAVPGWSLTGIGCAPSSGTTADVANRTVAVNLASGAAVTCTFTNVRTPPNGTACDDGNVNTVNDAWVNGVCTGTPTGTPTGTGTLTIVKDVQPGSDPQGFHFTAVGSGLNDFWLDDDASSTMPSSVTFTNLALGVPFTVTEDALSPWTVPSLQCYVAVPGLTTQTTDQLHRTFTVTLLDPGANVTCVFMNVR